LNDKPAGKYEEKANIAIGPIRFSFGSAFTSMLYAWYGSTHCPSAAGSTPKPTKITLVINTHKMILSKACDWNAMYSKARSLIPNIPKPQLKHSYAKKQCIT
jgi:hypothetical protein